MAAALQKDTGTSAIADSDPHSKQDADFRDSVLRTVARALGFQDEEFYDCEMSLDDAGEPCVHVRLCRVLTDDMGCPHDAPVVLDWNFVEKKVEHAFDHNVFFPGDVNTAQLASALCDLDFAAWLL